MNLNSPVSDIPSIGTHYKSRLERLGVKKVKDLLYHNPHRYLDFSKTVSISKVIVGQTYTLKGEMVFLKNQYTKTGKKMQLGEIKDESGKITVVWFNQPYLVRIFFPGEKISLAGKIEWFGRQKAIISPEYEKSGKSLHTGRLIPIYPETSGISSKWLRSKIALTYDVAGEKLNEFLPKNIISDNNLVNIKEAINNLHFPNSLTEAQKGKERLAFDELLFLHLAGIERKTRWQKNKPFWKLSVKRADLNKFIDSLPFTLTESQITAINELVEDLKKETPMNRLLEGDVGSGKTVVASACAFIAFINGFQTVFMAPTQILAQQHFNTLNRLFEKFKIRVSLTTSDISKESLGRTDIFVGTHALIHRKVNFENVALVIIDEQQRFGVEQRAHLIKKTGQKTFAPHVLTLTATPIPRTVALTYYGDLDLSVLRELPLGRKKITTWLVPPQKRQAAYAWINEKIKKEKIQAFIVCPLIEESKIETMQEVKAVTKEFKTLKKVFGNLILGLLHGKLKVLEKDKVITDFKKGKIHILVTTPVVEVGIDIPNAAIMLIEAAERFGLAQLHQLRGRVGRSDKKSYCLLFTNVRSPKVISRLKALEKGLSGFELSELDLKLRGPGEILGTMQHGFPELRIASWQDFDLNKKAKKAAEFMAKNPKSLGLVLKNLGKDELIAN